MKNTNCGRVRHKNLSIDTKAHKVYVNGKCTHFANTDYKILELLMLNIGKLVFREDILINVWGYKLEDISLSDNRKLDVHICNIRKILKRVDEKIAEYIVTDHCCGYRLEDE